MVTLEYMTILYFKPIGLFWLLIARSFRKISTCNMAQIKESINLKNFTQVFALM